MSVIATTNLTSALNSILSTLNSLPPQIQSTLNETQIQSTFQNLSNSLSPYLNTLSNSEFQNLLSNLTWINENLSELTGLLNQLPTKVLLRSNAQDLVELLKAGTMSLSILTVASPDIWSVLYPFLYACM